MRDVPDALRLAQCKVGDERRCEMSTLSHEPSGVTQVPRSWPALLFVRELWATIAIVAMWVAVAASTAWGGDLVTYSSGGSDRATVPSGIAVALFASIGTWAVAKYGFGDRRNDQG
jgi:hypothetical protein